MFKTCIIESRKRNNPDIIKTNDFTITFDYPFKNVNKVHLVGCYLPHTIYNIDSSNNSFTFTTDATYSLFLLNGNYTVTTLIQQLEDEMNLFSPTVFTISYSSVSYKITIQASTNFQLNLINSTLANVIGFNHVNYPSANVIVSDNAVDLNIPLVNICINEFGIDSIGKGDFNTFVVPINCIPNQLIIYNENNNFKQDVCFYRSKDIWSLNISLRKKDGFLLENNNTEWTMILLIELFKN